jgi:membrane protease YdiL (CAAX protease family)
VGLTALVLSLVTVVITEPPPATPSSRSERPRTWLRLGLVLAFVLLTGVSALAFHEVVAPDAVPLWSSLVQALRDAGDAWFGNGLLLSNPILYFVLPLILLLLTGARWTDLGLGRGHRVGRVVLLWAALPVAMLAVAVASGQLSPARLADRLVNHFFQNGFFEEFLFRGALQSTLRRLSGPAWAVVIQALVFGAWHLGLGFTNTDHAGLLPALASVIAHQAIIGLAFGILYERTRNLVAPSVAHILLNSVG